MWNLGFMSGMVGSSEILVVLFVILLLFGARKLPELARSLGRSLSEFKKGREEENGTTKSDAAKADAKPGPTDEPKG